MQIDVQIDQISNNKTILGIFIDSRSVYWTAYAKETKDEEKIRSIAYQPFIIQVINKYTQLRLTTADGQEGIRKGIQLLKKKLSPDLDALFEVNDLTEKIADNMSKSKYLF